MWNGVMDNIIKYIEKNDGEATKIHDFQRVINWDDDVKEIDK